LYTNTNTIVSTALTPYSVTTSQAVTRSTTFFRPKEVSQTNLMLNLDARVSAGGAVWKDQSGNNRHATATSISSVIPSDRCVALYNFHSDATDLTGNYTGTENNITYSSGKYGQAPVFNSSNSSINIGGDLVNNLTALSVSLWVNWIDTTNSTDDYFIALGKASSGKIFSADITNSTGIIGFYDGASVLNSTGAVPKNAWTHIAITANATALKIYLNGSLDSTHTISSLNFDSSGNAGFIGSWITGTDYEFDGSIDQLRIFNKAISAAEVTQLYNENSSTFKKVDIFNDATDGHYNLDGTDSFYMTHFITDQNFTIGGWFYRNSAGGSAGYETLWAQGYSPAVRCQIYGADGSASGNRLYIYLNNGSSGPSYDTGIDLPTGEWFHLMKTYDLSAGTVKVYLNSALKKTQSTITGNIYSSGNSDAYFRIAKNASNNSGYINGKISQVRVYDSVLTDAQIVDDYSTHDYLYI